MASRWLHDAFTVDSRCLHGGFTMPSRWLVLGHVCFLHASSSAPFVSSTPCPRPRLCPSHLVLGTVCVLHTLSSAPFVSSTPCPRSRLCPPHLVLDTVCVLHTSSSTPLRLTRTNGEHTIFDRFTYRKRDVFSGRVSV